MFGLVRWNDSRIQRNISMQAGSSKHLANIEPGTYTLKETTAPVGYVAFYRNAQRVVVAADMSITDRRSGFKPVCNTPR